jgi:hypothetical protein
MYKSIRGVAIAAAFVMSCPAFAATSVVYNNVPTGQSNFDATLTGAGGTVSTQVLNGGTNVYSNFTVSKTASNTYSQITGNLTDIAPQGTVRGPNGDSRASGVTFDFSTAVNSFGLNVGDWGTCCFPSSLYIAFDGGAPILVGTADTNSPAPLTNGAAAMFVGAFDDTNTFSKVEFWGDGFGEILYAGGTIRYGAVRTGGLGAVPEPATWAMMMLGFGVVGVGLRRSRRIVAPRALV